MDFVNTWKKAVKKNNSVLCAGLDPAEYAMQRGEKGLPENENKFFWSKRYIEAVADYCTVLKYNINYWKAGRVEEKSDETKQPQLIDEDMGNLRSLTTRARELGLLVIEDSKLADIGSTNDSGLFYAKQKVADAVTIAPFAGNLKEAAKQAEKYQLGLFSMCLMSNPEYEIEKNKLVPIEDDSGFDKEDLFSVKSLEPDTGKKLESLAVPQYIYLAKTAADAGIAGIVVGAPSDTNHIKEHEIERVKRYVGDGLLVLCPGMGFQGGNPGLLWNYFKKDQVVVNIGRSLMFPKGSNSSTSDQIEAAKMYRDKLNELRTTSYFFTSPS